MLSIGSKAQRKAADIKDEVRTARLAIQRAAYKLDASDPKRQELDRQLADAEAAVLRARLNHRDAMIDSLQLEWAYAVEREGALLDRMGWS